MLYDIVRNIFGNDIDTLSDISGKQAVVTPVYPPGELFPFTHVLIFASNGFVRNVIFLHDADAPVAVIEMQPIGKHFAPELIDAKVDFHLIFPLN